MYPDYCHIPFGLAYGVSIFCFGVCDAYIGRQYHSFKVWQEIYTTYAMCKYEHCIICLIILEPCYSIMIPKALKGTFKQQTQTNFMGIKYQNE